MPEMLTATIEKVELVSYNCSTWKDVFDDMNFAPRKRVIPRRRKRKVKRTKASKTTRAPRSRARKIKKMKKWNGKKCLQNLKKKWKMKLKEDEMNRK